MPSFPKVWVFSGHHIGQNLGKFASHFFILNAFQIAIRCRMQKACRI